MMDDFPVAGMVLCRETAGPRDTRVILSSFRSTRSTAAPLSCRPSTSSSHVGLSSSCRPARRSSCRHALFACVTPICRGIPADAKKPDMALPEEDMGNFMKLFDHRISIVSFAREAAIKLDRVGLREVWDRGPSQAEVKKFLNRILGLEVETQERVHFPAIIPLRVPTKHPEQLNRGQNASAQRPSALPLCRYSKNLRHSCYCTPVRRFLCCFPICSKRPLGRPWPTTSTTRAYTPFPSRAVESRRTGCCTSTRSPMRLQGLSTCRGTAASASNRCVPPRFHRHHHHHVPVCTVMTAASASNRCVPPCCPGAGCALVDEFRE